MARRRTSTADGVAALRAWAEGGATAAQVRTAVRYTLEELAESAPGNSVEVRVPPAGVTQIIEGPRHTRGTPPNTIEMAPQVWLDLVSGRSTWERECAAGRVAASGVRADLTEHLPLPGVVRALTSRPADPDGITSTS